MRDLRRLAARSGDAPVPVAPRPEAIRPLHLRPVQWLVRMGFLARGLTYGVIGVLALALALGAGTLGNDPDQQGALGLIATGVLGRLALVVIAAGLLAYALWKLCQGIQGRGPEGGGGTRMKDRIANTAGGLAYIAFFAVAVRVLVGSTGNVSVEQKRTAADVLSWPGGPLLVAIAGGALIAVSIYQAYDALRGGFAADSKLAEMGERERHGFMVLGRIGLTARAMVFALIGYFLLRTAMESYGGDTVGVDGALGHLHQQPYGPWLVGLVAAGLVVFAAFSFVEGRYRRL